MSIGKGIAICGMWVSVAVTAAFGFDGAVVGVAFFACIATAIVAIV